MFIKWTRFWAFVFFATPFLQASDIRVELLVDGLASPLYATHAGDGSGRLFIVERGGRVRIWDGQQLLVTPFLDISSRVSSGGERGLLGLAFHPGYAGNGRFFVNYTRLESDQLQTVVAEYQVSSGNPNLAGAGEQILLTFDQPNSNHNGGWMGFGPDGYLYIATGDGGGAGDPNGNGQNLNTLLGAILRIDVDSGSPYGIPPDNPFVGEPGADEIFAYGLRNPWRASFDRGSGRLMVGDVGQNRFEEVDIIVAGGNYGWNILEGDSCYPSGDLCDTTGLIPPIITYDRSEGVSVTGGYVYRGPEATGHVGQYIFGDFGSGRIWSLQEQGPGNWSRTLELVTTPGSLASFGEDEAGNLYIANLGGSILAIHFGEVPPEADLRLTLEVDSPQPMVGDTVSFLLTVENLGPDPAPGVTVSDQFPQSLRFKGASPTVGSCNPTSNLVVCNLGTLAPNQVVPITLLAEVEQAGTILNTASTSSDINDPVLGNNADTVSFLALPPPTDLRISKTVDPSSALVDSIITFEIRVSNLGPVAAGDLVMVDALPVGMTLESVSATAFECESENEIVTCRAGSLDPAAQTTVAIMARAQAAGSFRNEATISYDGQDSNPENNLAGVDVTISTAPDLSIEKSLRGGLFQGRKGEYLLRVTNLGGSATSSPISVQDALPEPLTFFAAEAADWACDVLENLVTCLRDAPLEPSQSSDIQLQVLVGKGVGDVSNMATVSVPGDANADNDTATSVEPMISLEELPLIYSQLALGGGFELILLISNRGTTPWEGVAQLREGNDLPWSRPWSLDSEDQVETSEFPIELASLSSRRYVLGGDASAGSGFLRISPAPGSVSTALAVSFFYQLSAEGVLEDSTATPQTTPGLVFQFPVEKRGTITDTGLAWAPLEAVDPFPVQLRLYDASGQLVSTQSREFGGHEDFLLEEMFSDLPDEFVGLLITESPQLIHLTVLRLDAGGTLQLTSVTPRVEPR